MPDTLPPSVPTGSARAARTAGKKLEFARQYCSQCPVPIQLISRHARSLDSTRKLQRIRTHKKRNRESQMDRGFGPMPESADYEARSARMAAVGAMRHLAHHAPGAWPRSRGTSIARPNARSEGL